MSTQTSKYPIEWDTAEGHNIGPDVSLFSTSTTHPTIADHYAVMLGVSWAAFVNVVKDELIDVIAEDLINKETVVAFVVHN